MQWRSPAYRRRSRACLPYRPCKCVFAHHGGLTPAALLRRSHRRRIVRDFHRTGLRSPTHGGLTPAALVKARLCSATVVIIPADGRCNSTRGGERQPLVLRQRLCSGNAKSPAGVHSRNTGAGGVSPPWSALRRRTRNPEIQRIAVPDAVSYPLATHGGLTFRGHGCSSVVAEQNPEFTSH